jgi:hypothetical protein
MAIKFPSNPVVGQVYTPSVLKIHNTVVSGDIDYVKFTTGSSPISAIYLTKYVSTDTKAFFAIQVGSTYTAGNDTTQMVTYGHFGPGGGQPAGSNILAGNPLAPAAVSLVANTTYTMWIQQTGGSLTEYVFSTSQSYTGETSLYSDLSSNALAPTDLGIISSNNNTWIWNGTTWAIQPSATASFVNVIASGTITATSFAGPLVGNTTGTHTGSVIGNVTGIASSAASLSATRLINNVAFDGTNDVTIPASAETLTGTTIKSTVVLSNLTAVGTLSSLNVNGITTVTGTAAVTGNITAGSNVVISTTPTSATHATNKAYVDARAVAMSIAMS